MWQRRRCGPRWPSGVRDGTDFCSGFNAICSVQSQAKRNGLEGAGARPRTAHSSAGGLCYPNGVLPPEVHFSDTQAAVEVIPGDESVTEIVVSHSRGAAQSSTITVIQGSSGAQPQYHRYAFILKRGFRQAREHASEAPLRRVHQHRSNVRHTGLGDHWSALYVGKREFRRPKCCDIQPGN